MLKIKDHTQYIYIYTIKSEKNRNNKKLIQIQQSMLCTGIMARRFKFSC